MVGMGCGWWVARTEAGGEEQMREAEGGWFIVGCGLWDVKGRELPFTSSQRATQPMYAMMSVLKLCRPERV